MQRVLFVYMHEKQSSPKLFLHLTLSLSIIICNHSSLVKGNKGRVGTAQRVGENPHPAPPSPLRKFGMTPSIMRFVASLLSLSASMCTFRWLILHEKIVHAVCLHSFLLGVRRARSLTSAQRHAILVAEMSLF